MKLSDSTEKQRSDFIRRYDNIIRSVRAWILKSTNVTAALNYAGLYGEIRTFNHDGVYADEEIEQRMEALVMESGRVDTQAVCASRGEGVLVLATNLYDYGGHTKVLMTWLELMREMLPHKLVITESLTESTGRHIANLAIDIVKVSNVGLEAVIEILDAAKGFDRVVMLIHPQDIISAVAAKILAVAGYHVTFYNHADHVFTFGMRAAHVVCEISTYGEAINRRTGRVKCDSVMLGVPLKKIDFFGIELPTELPQVIGYRTILTVGTSYKYKPDEDFLFADFIDALLLKRADVRLIFVGPTGQEEWWQKRRAKWGERVLFLGMLPNSEYIKLLKIADIYLDSYPITGGTAFPEALLAGKACAGLITPVQGYSYADELKVESPEKLVQQIEKILDADSEVMLRLNVVRGRVAELQSEGAFLKRILRISEGSVKEIHLSENDVQNKIDSQWLERKWYLKGTITKPRTRTMKNIPSHRLAWILFSILRSNLYSRCIKVSDAK